MKARRWVLCIPALASAAACSSPGGRPSSSDEGIGAEDGTGGVPGDGGTTTGDEGTSTSGADGDGTDGNDGAETGSTKYDVGGAEGGDTTGELTPCESVAQTASNQGCEFWAVDLPNAWSGLNGSPSPEDQQFAIVVANTAGDGPAEVSIFVGASQTPGDTATVQVGQIHAFEVPPASIEPRANSTDGVAYRIESDQPITAYQFQPLDNTVEVFSNDASLLFPTHVLGNDYMAVTGDAISLNTDQGVDNSGAFVSIVADRDGTQVEFFPTDTLYPGPTNVTLDRGQVATFVSNNPSDQNTVSGSLSGSRVRADGPVAVFSGNVATIEPVEAFDCCADHLEHQMLPLVAWGHRYVATPAAAPNGSGTGDLAGFRITGAFDGTTLTYSPARPSGAPQTIDAGETVRFETDTAFTVSSAPETPFALTQFLLSNFYLRVQGQPGDPAMISVPAIDQFQGLYIFLVPDGYDADFVTLTRPIGTTVLLDELDVDGEDWHPLGTLDGVDWEYAHIAVAVGSHVVRAEPDDVGIGIISAGYSDDVSYGYPGGSGVAVISAPPPPPG